jgi:hypothetical protein
MKRPTGDAPRIHIDALNIRLPEDFRHRTDAIARQTARHLSHMPVPEGADIARLSVPAVSLSGGETDGVVGRRIAKAIHAGIRREIRGGAQGGSGRMKSGGRHGD